MSSGRLSIKTLALVLLLARPLAAQDCPVKHPPLTALDHASMLAAYTASFEGIYHRAPSLQPGSGVEDGEYWIAVSNHYGEFSDGICRAGWSRYWEHKLTGTDSADPREGDQPAQFQPVSSPPPAPPPPIQPPPVIPPPPPVVVSPDLSDLKAQIAQLLALEQQQAALAQDTNGKVTHIDSEVRTFSQQFGAVMEFVGKYVAPAIAAWFTAKGVAK